VYAVVLRRQLCKLLYHRPFGGEKILRRRGEDSAAGTRFCGGAGKCCCCCYEPSKVSNVIRRINTPPPPPPPPVVSRMHRANGINPDKPTRINPQTKRKRVIYKIYRYTRMVHICVCVCCTYAVWVCEFK